MFQVWFRNFRVWVKHLRASLVGNIGQPVLFLVAMGYGIGTQVQEIEGMSYLQFIAPGLVASSVMSSAAFESTYGAYTRLSNQGTFEAILMTPVTVHELALGEVLWGASKGLVSGLVMIAALPFFGVLPSWQTVFLVPVLFVEGMLFSALGMIMVATASNYEYFNYFTSLIITPLFLFSGIFFPLSSLNGMAGIVCRWLPLAGPVNLSRMLCYGRPYEMWLVDIGVLVALTFLSASIAAFLLKRRMIV
jgi:lipooligosaccharide transport system permease protein